MRKCAFCGKRIWPWQRAGYNSSWHKQCTKMNEYWYGTLLNLLRNSEKPLLQVFTSSAYSVDAPPKKM